MRATWEMLSAELPKSPLKPTLPEASRSLWPPVGPSTRSDSLTQHQEQRNTTRSGKEHGSSGANHILARYAPQCRQDCRKARSPPKLSIFLRPRKLWLRLGV